MDSFLSRFRISFFSHAFVLAAICVFESTVSLAFYKYLPRFVSAPLEVLIFLALGLAGAAILGLITSWLSRNPEASRLSIRAAVAFPMALCVFLYVLPRWWSIFESSYLTKKAWLGLIGLGFGSVVVGLGTAAIHARLSRLPSWLRPAFVGGIGVTAVLISWVFSDLETRPRPGLLAAAEFPSPIVGPSQALPVPDTVVILSFDALRADHLSAYGYERATSPELDRWIAEGLRFERAWATRASTPPSLASLLTGLYPPRHGLMQAGWRLTPGLSTLATLLDGRYVSAAFVTNPIFAEAVQDAGFHQVKTWKRPPSAPKVLAAASDWLASQENRPAFLWVHLFEPHSPYLSPDEDQEPFLEDPWFDAYARAPYSLEAAAVALGGQLDSNTPQDVIKRRVHEEIAAYDGFIRFATREAAEFLERVRAMRQRPLFVLTSDHGESLVEHDFFFWHGKVCYDTVARVPLVFHYAEGLPGGLRTEPASLVDIVPTICGLVGCESSEPFDGLDLLAAESDDLSGRPVFVSALENSRYNRWAIEHDGWKLIMTPRRIFSPVDGGIEARARLLAWMLGKEPPVNPYRFRVFDYELFELSRDPGETRNLASAEPEVRDRLAAEILEFLDRQYRAAASRRTSRPQTISPETLEQMRALGYL